MGFVVKAHHRLLNKTVALKLLTKDWTKDGARLARFRREIQILAQLDHPNLVKATDARSVGEWQVVAMDWVDGMDLHQLMASHGRIPISDACEAVRQAALGLQHAHEHGLIHRDVKPSNLMLSSAGTIKVIDMGLALNRDEAASNLTQSGVVMGTMNYCAPEQIRNPSAVDIRADIYSLGCTLFHLLTGKPPHASRKTMTEVLQAHLEEPLPKVGEARLDAPEGLEAVLNRMTEKDPSARFPTPAAVAEALAPFARGADLTSLVRAKNQPVPTDRSSRGDSLAPAASLRSDSSAERPAKLIWTRRDVLIGIGGTVFGGAAFWAVRRPGRDWAVPARPIESVNSFLEPVVVLMDSPVERAVYDGETKAAGKTNAEVLQNKVLNNLPVRCVQVTISEDASKRDWRGENNVITHRPKLVVIHRSAFFHPVNEVLELGYPEFKSQKDQEKWDYLYAESDDKLICFMGYVATVLPGVKFLVYSRGTDVRWKSDEFRAQWVENCEQRFPALKGGLVTMLVKPSSIPGSERGTFKDPATASEIQEHVKKVFGFPDPAEQR